MYNCDLFLNSPVEQFEILMLGGSYFAIYSNTAGFYGLGALILTFFFSDSFLSGRKITISFLEDWAENELAKYLRTNRLDAWPFIIMMPYLILIFNWAAYLPVTFVSFATVVLPAFFITVFFIYMNVLGLGKLRTSYLKVFCPVNGEYWVRPFIFLIEIFAYLGKYVSLGLRLFSNVLSGHIILEVLGSGAVMSFFAGNFFSFVLTFLLTIALLVMELSVSLAQSFLFITLLCLYSSDFEE